ncbi:alpha-isopropylmalate synthase regulatory domain-containing protein [Pantanalinema rosaneae CENA516]|uniref:alpha-isopropylmalate synthase regulatory domain-containing protein n=1 Tax=Pantanalinema rosaneae TaxID=1620701 RepID=UPI003D6E151F
MPQRVSCTALVTANVFQNVLARHDPRCEYHIDLLRRLALRSVKWYMTEIDWRMAHNCWTLFGVEVDQVCAAAYMGMLNLIQPCRLDQQIQELSGSYQINFYDALRLACAIDRNVDVIVTQEPHQFAQTIEEHYRVQRDGYVYVSIPSYDAETDDLIEMQIGVFAVGAFLLSLDELAQDRQPKPQGFQYFRLEQFEFLTRHDANAATLTLRDPVGQLLTMTANGNSPLDAIQAAIDQIVDQCYPIPLRRIIRFLVTPETLVGADSPVEVVVGVECDELRFEKSARSGNWNRAAADAYIKVINSICEHLKLPIPDREDLRRD